MFFLLLARLVCCRSMQHPPLPTPPTPEQHHSPPYQLATPRRSTLSPLPCFCTVGRKRSPQPAMQCWRDLDAYLYERAFGPEDSPRARRPVTSCGRQRVPASNSSPRRPSGMISVAGGQRGRGGAGEGKGAGLCLRRAMSTGRRTDNAVSSLSILAIKLYDVIVHENVTWRIRSSRRCRVISFFIYDWCHATQWAHRCLSSVVFFMAPDQRRRLDPQPRAHPLRLHIFETISVVNRKYSIHICFVPVDQ